MSVGLVKPKPNVFNHGYVKHLLVVTTTAQILVLGVRFTSALPEGPLGPLETLHLLPEPILDIPTEGVLITTITCSDNGRLFLGGRDGSLFEIDYRVNFRHCMLRLKNNNFLKRWNGVGLENGSTKRITQLVIYPI